MPKVVVVVGAGAVVSFEEPTPTATAAMREYPPSSPPPLLIPPPSLPILKREKESPSPLFPSLLYSSLLFWNNARGTSSSLLFLFSSIFSIHACTEFKNVTFILGESTHPERKITGSPSIQV